MRDPKSSVTRRITAGIMAFMMLVIVLFSAFCIAAETDHDCAGEDCAVCACLRQCENTLRGIGEGAPVQAFAVIPVLSVLLAGAFFVTAILRETPVSAKVRLNN